MYLTIYYIMTQSGINIPSLGVIKLIGSAQSQCKDFQIRHLKKGIMECHDQLNNGRAKTTTRWIHRQHAWTEFNGIWIVPVELAVRVRKNPRCSRPCHSYCLPMHRYLPRFVKNTQRASLLDGGFSQKSAFSIGWLRFGTIKFENASDSSDLF